MAQKVREARKRREEKRREQEELREMKDAQCRRDEQMYQDALDFDWNPDNLKNPPEKQVKLPLSVHDVDKNGGETPEERVLRMLGPMERLVRSCSMCSLGRKLCTSRDTTFDPHVFSTQNFSRWMVVGQNPGFNECVEQQPFVGDSGSNFNKEIEKHGLSRSDFYITNAVKCFTPNNRKPSVSESDRCRSFLRMEIALLRPHLIITLGAVGYGVFFDDKKMSESLGEVLYCDEFDVNVYPIYHPSPRNLSVEIRREQFEDDIERLCDLFKAANK